jgi:hypothetical protein
MMKMLTSYLTLILGFLAISAAPVSAAMFIYEGFDNTYSDSTIVGTSTFNGGSGFAGAWGGSTTNVPFSISDGTGHSHGGSDPAGLTFSGLTTNDGFVLTRKSAPGGAEVNRTINSTVASNMASSTLYFSVLVRTKFYSVGNENLAFAFGTSDVFDPNAKPVTSGGEAIGFALQGSGSNIDFQALAVDGGVTSTSAVGGLTHSSPQIQMIYGQIDWGATDTITLFHSLTDTNQASFTQFASLSADLNESAFDTLHVAGQQVSSIDEIRFGDSLADIGVVAIPEPSSLSLIGLGLGGLYLLRRRS